MVESWELGAECDERRAESGEQRMVIIKT